MRCRALAAKSPAPSDVYGSPRWAPAPNVIQNPGTGSGHAPAPRSSSGGEGEALVAVGGGFVALLSIGPYAADVGQQAPRLTLHVRTHIPRVGLGHERCGGDLFVVLDSLILRLLGRLADLHVVVAHVLDAVAGRWSCCTARPRARAGRRS